MPGRVSLIAHRGQPQTLPENSLQGFSHAISSGALYVETDVNITADGIPVLSHDAHLLKLTGKQIIVADHNYDQIKGMDAGHSERFGDKFKDYRIATLQQFSELLMQSPNVTCFIELKQPSLSNFGMKAVDIMMKSLNNILSQVVMISFDHDAVAYAKKNYDVPVGWVLPKWSEENRLKAIKLSPQYLFVDSDFCPKQKSDIWPGPWDWVVYTLNKAKDIAKYASLGIELIETNRYSDLKKESKIVDVSNDF